MQLILHWLNVQKQKPMNSLREEYGRFSGVQNMVGQREMRTFTGHTLCCSPKVFNHVTISSVCKTENKILGSAGFFGETSTFHRVLSSTAVMK